VDDLIQDTYLRLCAGDYRAFRTLRSTEAQSVHGVAQAAAVTVTLDHFRAAAARKRGGDRQPTSLDGLPFAAGDRGAGELGVERELLLRQIDRQLSGPPPPETRARDRRVFWLYYRHGFTAKEISRLPGLGLSPKGVESTLHRLTMQLREYFAGADRRAEGESA